MVDVKDRLMKPLRRPAAAITQQKAGLTMMARESKKGKKESDKKSTNRRKKGHTSEGLESKQKMPAPTYASHVS